MFLNANAPRQLVAMARLTVTTPLLASCNHQEGYLDHLAMQQLMICLVEEKIGV